MSKVEAPIHARIPLRTRIDPLQLSLVALFGGAIAIALAPIFVRLSPVGPSATAFWRLALALPALFIWMLFEQGRVSSNRPTSRAEWSSMVVVGLFFAADLGMWHWSISFQFPACASATRPGPSWPGAV